MIGSRRTRLGGIACLVGGTTWVAALAAVQLLSQGLVALLAVPALLFVLGVGALNTRQGPRSGTLARAGLLVTIAGAGLLAYGSVGQATLSGALLGLGYGPIVFEGPAPGLLVIGLGVALVAASTIAADVLPRLSPVPLLVGSVGVATAGGLALIRQLGGGPGAFLVFPLLPFGILWAIFGLGWIWLGYLLWSDRGPRLTGP